MDGAENARLETLTIFLETSRLFACATFSMLFISIQSSFLLAILASVSPKIDMLLLKALTDIGTLLGRFLIGWGRIDLWPECVRIFV